MSRTPTPAARVAAAVTTLGLAMALGGCSAVSGLLSGGQGPSRDEDTGEVTESGDVDVFHLKVGDCLNLGDDTEVTTAAVVPCSEPHTDEIYHTFEMTDEDDEWPGADAVAEAADEGCYDRFESFVGIPYNDSVLEYNYLAPLAEGWNDPAVQDRLIQCIIYEPTADGAAELTGSLEGAAR